MTTVKKGNVLFHASINKNLKKRLMDGKSKYGFSSTSEFIGFLLNFYENELKKKVKKSLNDDRDLLFNNFEEFADFILDHYESEITKRMINKLK